MPIIEIFSLPDFTCSGCRSPPCGVSARFVAVAWALTLIGIACTLPSKWLNVEWRGASTYAAAMPRIPWFGTGVTPVLQWLFLPLLRLLVARRLVGQTPNFGAVS